MSVIQKLKTLASSQLYRIANVAGHRNNFNGLGLSGDFLPDHGIDPLSDNNGRAIVRLADQYGYTDMGNINGGTNNLGFVSTDSGYVDKLEFGVIPGHLAETCFLLQAFGFNSDPLITYWVQLLVGANATWILGAKPSISILVPPLTNFSLVPTPSPSGLMVATNEFVRRINNIILEERALLAVSTTGPTYTPLGAGVDPFFLHIAFRSLTVDV